MKVTALAGGVGGAKLAKGLANLLAFDELCIIVNTGDDFIYSGLYICPDIDTVTYTLAGINNPITGWGLKGDTWNVLSALEKLESPSWFKLGDRDLATHLERTRLRDLGLSLTQITKRFANHLGVKHSILPMTDHLVQTRILTNDLGEISFQEYFVKYGFQPVIQNIRFAGIENSSISSEICSCIQSSNLIIFCPSNPFVSINPILSIPGMRDILKEKIIIAVSPLIGGKTIKGPAAKMMLEMGIPPRADNVAKYYGNLLTGFLLDNRDHDEAESIRQCGIIPFETDILMPDEAEQIRVARETIEFGQQLTKKDQ